MRLNSSPFRSLWIQPGLLLATLFIWSLRVGCEFLTVYRQQALRGLDSGLWYTVASASELAP
jgi:hypothetical protein